MKRLLSIFPVLLLTLLVGLIGSSPAYGAATIVIQNADAANVGFNDSTPVPPVGGNSGTTVGQQRLNAFQFAANIWGATITSNVTITISASWAALPCTANSGTLGSAGTNNIHANFTNAPFTNFWYTAAEANALAGRDLNTTNAEISARFNSSLGTSGCLQTLFWYYGFDNNHGTNGVDLVSVLLHEFGHGLGFASFTDEETGTQISGLPSIYDKFLFDTTANKTWPQMTDVERKASAINTNNLVWNGPQVVSDAAILAAGKDSQGRPRLYAPNPVSTGSSVSHWDISASPNQLMEPNISGNLTHSVSTPQDLTYSLLRDVGWCPTCAATPPPSPPSPPAYDAFASSLTLTACAGHWAGSNIAATKEAGEPNHAGNAGGTSIWFRWQAPSSGSVTIDTIGSNFDTMLGVYTGSSVSALNLIASNDDIVLGQNISSSVTFNAVAGTTYRIVVDGYAADSGNVKLNWTLSGCTTGNPIDGAQFFVDRQYQDFLGRYADLGGFQYWTEQVAGNVTNTPPPCAPGDRICENIRHINVSAAFFVENEFQQTGYFVYRMYEASYNRQPTFSEFTTDRAQVSGGSNTEAKKQAFADNWVQRPAFLSNYPTSLTPEAFVDRLFSLAELFPYNTERAQLAADIRNGVKTRAQVVRAVIEITELVNREYNRAFVLMQYFGYLQRDPDAGGYQFWLDILNNRVPNNFRAMVCAFLTSTEYQQRFGSTITRSNSDCSVVGP